MCDLGHHDHHEHFGFLVDAPEIRALIDETMRLRKAISDDAARVEALRPAFAALLAAEGWLPDSCANGLREELAGRYRISARIDEDLPSAPPP